MYEKRIPPTYLKDFTFPEQPLYVVVNDFETSTLKGFMKECEKVLQTGQQFLPIIIDSYGGQVYTLLGIIDFLKYVGVPVTTICQAKAMSAGAILFSCGEERYMGEASTLMVHQLSSYFWGKNVDIQNEAKECERLNKMLFNILDQNTGQKKGFWWDMVHENKHTDLFLTANQAKRHGFATHIGIPHIETKVEVTRRLVL